MGLGRERRGFLESEIGLRESLGGGFEFDNGVDVEALDIDPVKGMCFFCVSYLLCFYFAVFGC